MTPRRSDTAILNFDRLYFAAAIGAAIPLSKVRFANDLGHVRARPAKICSHPSGVSA
jgi:hypothetical protein